MEEQKNKQNKKTSPLKNTPVVHSGDHQLEREKLLEEIRFLRNRILELQRTKAAAAKARQGSAPQASAAARAGSGGGSVTESAPREPHRDCWVTPAAACDGHGRAAGVT